MIFAPNSRHQISPLPARATLFLAAGELACRAAQRLAPLAERLRIRAEGRFGFVLRSNTKSECRLEFTLGVAAPEATAGGALAPNVSALVRRLNSISDDVRVKPLADSRCDVYLLVDVANLTDVRQGLALLGELLAETNLLDVTLIAITGRSAAGELRELPTHDSAAQWRMGLRELLQACDDRRRNLPIHRLYVVDGMNSRRAWLASDDQACDMVAEFLLHHSVGAKRAALRQRERSRMSRKEPIEQFVGSFSCRTMSSELEQIVDEVAAEYAGETSLFGDLSPPPPGFASTSAQAVLSELDKNLDQLVLGDSPPATRTDLRGKILGHIGGALAAVAHAHPVRNLRAFLGDLERAAEAFRLKVRLIERQRERDEAARELARQAEADVIREKQRLYEESQSPHPCQPPEFVFMVRPVPMARRVLGVVLILAGALLACLFGVLESFLPLVGGGALMAIGGLCLDFFRRPWRRERVGSAYIGDEEFDTFREERLIYPPSTPAAVGAPSKKSSQRDLGPTYDTRCRRPLWRTFLGFMLFAAGVVLTAHAFDASVLLSRDIREVWGVAAAAFVALLAALITLAERPGRKFHPTGKANDDPSDQYFTGTDQPLAYFPRSIGAYRVFFAAIVLGCLGYVVTQWPIGLRTTDFPWPWDWVPGTIYAQEYAELWAQAGLCLAALGLLTLAWPSNRKVKIGRPGKVLPPPPPYRDWQDIVGPRRISGDVDACLLEAQDWIKSLYAEPQAIPPADPLVWPEPFPRETFLDAVTENWPRRLADVAREDLRAAITNPAEWAKLILEGLDRPDDAEQVTTVNLPQAFSRRFVRRWLGSQVSTGDWSTLIASLDAEPGWLGRFFERQLAPQWPVADSHVTSDSGLALVDTDLAAASGAAAVFGADPRQGSHCRIEPVEWPGKQNERRRVTLLRIVQGIPEPYLHNLLYTQMEETP